MIREFFEQFFASRSSLERGKELSHEFHEGQDALEKPKNPQKIAVGDPKKGATIGGIIGGIFALFGGATLLVAILVAGAAAGLGYLTVQSTNRRLEEEAKEKIDYYLPLTMERIVMAVLSGYDIISAIKVTKDLPTGEAERDPVSVLFDTAIERIEGGATLEKALRELADSTTSTALRHSLLHLSHAASEGGELVTPLQELSDATQAYYQDSTEEMIARLPAKAMFPLLVVFAGLILMFITPPLVQVTNISTREIAR